MKQFTKFLIALMILSLAACAAPATPAPEVPAATEAPAAVAPAATEPPAAPASTEIVVPVYKWMDNYELEWVDTAKYKKDPPTKSASATVPLLILGQQFSGRLRSGKHQKHPEISESIYHRCW